MLSKTNQIKKNAKKIIFPAIFFLSDSQQRIRKHFYFFFKLDYLFRKKVEGVAAPPNSLFLSWGRLVKALRSIIGLSNLASPELRCCYYEKHNRQSFLIRSIEERNALCVRDSRLLLEKRGRGFLCIPLTYILPSKPLSTGPIGPFGFHSKKSWILKYTSPSLSFSTRRRGR